MKAAPKKNPATSASAVGPATAKRDKPAQAKVELVSESKGANFPPGKMLVATPLDVNAVLARIPEGRVLTMSDLRVSLAKSFKADYTCPLTTGIFLRVCAEAAEEERAAGRPSVPYWRVVRDDGSMIAKFPGGETEQARKLERDGVEIFRMRDAAKVSDLEHFGWRAPPLGKKAAR
jgi:alkylated DNA nucleotide flippase Atl1